MDKMKISECRENENPCMGIDLLFDGMISEQNQEDCTHDVHLESIGETSNSVETVDGRPSHTYEIQKGVAESAMDISLLTANANQLRLLITYNYDSKTYVACIAFVILSLFLQIFIAVAFIIIRVSFRGV